MPDINLAKISNFLIQRQGFKTVFFGDSASLEFFKDIPFDEVYEIKKEEIENIPKCIWSMSKFIAISKMNEPFLHVDLDFLFFKIDKVLINKNILCFHSEFNLEKNIKTIQKLIHIRPKGINNIEQICYNCGIIGGNNFNFLKKIVNELLTYISNNKDYIDTIFKNNLNNNDIFCGLYPILVEQVWMFQLFKLYNEDFYTYLTSDISNDLIQQECYEKGIIHFQKAELLQSVKLTLNEFVNNFKLV